MSITFLSGRRIVRKIVFGRQLNQRKDDAMALFTFSEEKCIKCGACVSECPIRIVAMESEDSPPTPFEPLVEFCISCGHCVAVCPTGALALADLAPEDCDPVLKELEVSPEQARQMLGGRRSIRTFQKEPLSRSRIEDLIQVASEAASAKNVQPWRFLVIEERAKVKELAGLVVDWMKDLLRRFPNDPNVAPFNRATAAWDAGYDIITRGAPHLILLHADKAWPFAWQDCTLALAHLDLYANSLGLGACWAGYFQSCANQYPPLQQALALPEGQACFGAMMLGKPKFKYFRLPQRKPPQTKWM